MQLWPGGPSHKTNEQTNNWSIRQAGFADQTKVKAKGLRDGLFQPRKAGETAFKLCVEQLATSREVNKGEARQAGLAGQAQV